MAKTKKIEFRADDYEFGIIYQYWKKYGYPEHRIGPFCRQLLIQLSSTGNKTHPAPDQSCVERLIQELERQNGFLNRLFLSGFEHDSSEPGQLIDKILHEAGSLINHIQNQFPKRS